MSLSVAMPVVRFACDVVAGAALTSGASGGGGGEGVQYNVFFLRWFPFFPKMLTLDNDKDVVAPGVVGHTKDTLGRGTHRAESPRVERAVLEAGRIGELRLERRQQKCLVLGRETRRGDDVSERM